MSTRIFFVLTLFLHDFVYADKYEVPKAQVEILHPKGFRVCIPDEDGIQLFAFHGSINKELPDLQAGDYSADVLRRNNGVWCFVDSNKKLNFGDVINYWTYVQYDRLGYRRDGQNHTVTSFLDVDTPIGSYLKTSTTTFSSLLPTLPTLPPFPNTNVIDTCGQQINVLDNNINQLHEQINKLIETNSQILRTLRILEMRSSELALIVTDVNSVQTDPQAIITDIISNKLDIPMSEYTIKASERLNDGSVIFEINSKAEKNRILSKWQREHEKYPGIIIEDVLNVKRDRNTTHESDDSPEFVLDVRRGQ